MANHGRFLLVVLAFWRIFAPDAAASSAADSLTSVGDQPVAVELMAPPFSDDPNFASWGEPQVSEGGSAALVVSPAPTPAEAPDYAPYDSTITVRLTPVETEPAAVETTAVDLTLSEPDPWALAFAESARLMNGPVAAVSAYPVDHDQDQVRFFLDRFTGSRRDLLTLYLSRSSKYLGMIRETLKRNGLPEDLAFTAMIESGFNPVAVSRAGAKGLWQFMAATARRYGLRVDQWVDERLDPEKSTVAAAAYLRDLYSQFGSWHLAQAAYNAGESTVTKAIQATGSTDFWTLARSRFLKRETKEFVPQIQAATVIGRDPARFGFEAGEVREHAVERVVVPASTDLRRLSAVSGISPETLRSLNPVLVRGVTPPGTSYEVAVPPGSRSSVVSALARKDRLNAGSTRVAAARDVHVVRPRETVSSIAKHYGVSVNDLLRWNRLDKQDPIRPGDRLRIADLRRSVDRDGQGGFR
jgi:LysM repeat protein